MQVRGETIPGAAMNATPRLHIEAYWNRQIAAAVSLPNAVQANAAITAVHAELGRALTRLLGDGPNFHTWAVWGSSKAGETIRGEGNERAEWELPLAAAVVGGLAGLVIAWPFAVSPSRSAPTRVAPAGETTRRSKCAGTTPSGTAAVGSLY